MRLSGNTSSARSSGVLLAVLSRWLLHSALGHPQANQAPDGYSLLVGEPLDDRVELGVGLSWPDEAQGAQAARTSTSPRRVYSLTTLEKYTQSTKAYS